MDLIRDLGLLALGSRLKRLTASLMADGALLYQEAGLDFTPKWFTTFYYLAHHGPAPVTQIANHLGVSHPMVNKVAAEMDAHGLVVSQKDPSDKRRRVLALSDKGRAMIKDLEPVWQDIQAALQGLVADAKVDWIEVLEKTEASQKEQSFLERCRAARKARRIREIEIIAYDPTYREAFYDINREWVETLFEMEEEDRKVLQNPESEIIAKGGEVWFARHRESGEILGTVALHKGDHDHYEMIKMGVRPEARGYSIGEQLGVALIEEAKRRGIDTVYLETNSKLTPALNLYRKLGFKSVPLDPNTPFARCNVRMALALA
ncbi:bifunctional helix-turn-helix transcriptional regulator/GNAT family N-acetyltransferase [Acanthopleuribacter pedis]|uniref:MarR family transcriptional regulator n=1 Tax=Acanthopleuribacter pedis TaxID=442870 RepID=A0A8J7U4V4_9BACT|nr:helix-turn-helix domain-containing GNAT family N-acetyltransferase [Acanthopleuribacter pedis]MBO1319843.1 MarR family transcriptional regulator [Acanthopleuribacter pedis]